MADVTVFLHKLYTIFFPPFFVRTSQKNRSKVQTKQKKSFVLLEKYDKGEIEIDYSTELKKLKKFAKAS